MLATLATARTRISRASLSAGILALAGWCLFALLGPTLLGIDHQGLLDIVKAGDNTALHKGFGNYPLRVLAPVAAGAGLFALVCAAHRGGRTGQASAAPCDTQPGPHANELITQLRARASARGGRALKSNPAG